jgi:hypothetical protein
VISYLFFPIIPALAPTKAYPDTKIADEVINALLDLSNQNIKTDKHICSLKNKKR